MHWIDVISVAFGEQPSDPYICAWKRQWFFYDSIKKSQMSIRIYPTSFCETNCLHCSACHVCSVYVLIWLDAQGDIYLSLAFNGFRDWRLTSGLANESSELLFLQLLFPRTEINTESIYRSRLVGCPAGRRYLFEWLLWHQNNFRIFSELNFAKFFFSFFIYLFLFTQVLCSLGIWKLVTR